MKIEFDYGKEMEKLEKEKLEWECSIVDIVDSGGWWLVYILVSIVPIDIIDSLISVDILDSKRSLDFIVSLFRFVDIVDLWISTTIVDSL